MNKNLAYGYSNKIGKLAWNIKRSDFKQITGTGFGSKQEHVYANDMEKMPLGNISSGNTQGLILSIAGGTTIATDLKHSGTRSYKKDYFNTDDFPKLYVNLPAPSQNAYFSCWFRYANDDFAGAPVWNSTNTYAINDSVTRGNTRYKAKQAVAANIDPATDYSYTYWAIQANVWKFGRMGNTLNDPYHQNRYHYEFTGTIPTSQTSALYSIENEYAPYIANNQVSYDPLLLTKDTWHFYEMWATAGTLNGADSTFEARIDGIPTTRYINGNFKTNSKPDGIQSILTPICGLDNTWQAGKSNTQMWMDEVYVTSSLKRVVMTDSANYATSTKWCIQLDEENGWTDGVINYIPTRGDFTQGQTAYLHVINGNTVLHTTTIVVP